MVKKVGVYLSFLRLTFLLYNLEKFSHKGFVSIWLFKKTPFSKKIDLFAKIHHYTPQPLWIAFVEIEKRLVLQSFLNSSKPVFQMRQIVYEYRLATLLFLFYRFYLNIETANILTLFLAPSVLLQKYDCINKWPERDGRGFELKSAWANLTQKNKL